MRAKQQAHRKQGTKLRPYRGDKRHMLRGPRAPQLEPLRGSAWADRGWSPQVPENPRGYQRRGGSGGHACCRLLERRPVVRRTYHVRRAARSPSSAARLRVCASRSVAYDVVWKGRNQEARRGGLVGAAGGCPRRCQQDPNPTATVLLVSQHASPCRSFLTDTGSLRLARSWVSSGRSRVSIECSTARKTRC